MIGWLNTDLNSAKEIVFQGAGKRLPFGDCTFNYLFTEHFIEHLKYRAGVQLVQGCYGILKRGERLRISTPDFIFLIEHYDENKTEAQKRYIKWEVDQYTLVRFTLIPSSLTISTEGPQTHLRL